MKTPHRSQVNLTLPAFLATLLAIGAMTAIGPVEKTLGANVRVVYLHGAWVWTALIALAGAGLTGLLGLIFRQENWQVWSLALGRTGLLFWVTYLPVSVWAMQTSWNGLYLAEPRWRLAVIFSISGLLLQLGLTFLGSLRWAALANLIFFLILTFALLNTPNVMHPPSPILSSEAIRIRFYFGSLFALMLLAAGQVALLWRRP